MDSNKLQKTSATTLTKIMDVYKNEEMDVAMNLMCYDNEQFSTKRILNLIEFVKQEPKAKTALMKRGIQCVIEKNLNSRQVTVLKLTMKLLREFMTHRDMKKRVIQSFEHTAAVRVAKLYAEVADTELQYMCLRLIILLTKNYFVRFHLLQNNLTDHIQKILITSEDEDIEKYTFVLLTEVIRDPEIPYKLVKSKFFSFDKLMTHYLKHPQEDIQTQFLKLLDYLTALDEELIIQKLVKEKLAQKMFVIALQEDGTNLGKYAMKVFMNCIRHEVITKAFAKSPEMIKFLDFSKTCEDEHCRTSVTVMGNLSQVTDVHQRLYNLGTVNALIALTRSKNLNVLYDLFEAIKTFIVHPSFARELITPETMDVLIGLLKCRQKVSRFNSQALDVIHKFLTKGLEPMEIFEKRQGMHRVMNLYMNYKKQMGLTDLANVLRILNIFSGKPSFDNPFVSEEFCQWLLEDLSSMDNIISNLSLNIIYDYRQNALFMKYFLKLNGPFVIVQKLKQERDEDTITDIIDFVYAAMVRFKIAESFLRAGLLSLIETLIQRSGKFAAAVENVLDVSYKLFLPLKFHEKGRLDIDDKMYTGFYVIEGDWKVPFPFLDQLVDMEVTNEFTVYVIDYGTPEVVSRERDRVSTIKKGFSSPSGITGTYLSDVPVSDKSRKTNQDFQNERQFSKESNSCNQETKFRSMKPKQKDCLKDPSMNELIHDISFKIEYNVDNSRHPMKQKVALLAMFIADRTSESENSNMQCNSNYCKDVAKIKVALQSNVIPVGLIHTPSYTHRALLFKALADKVGIPATLCRSRTGKLYNEVYIVERITAENDMPGEKVTIQGVVDLVEEIGHIYPCGSKEANKYSDLWPPDYRRFNREH